MAYTTNWLEDYINNMYRAIGIHHPHQLDPEDIAARHGLEVVYLPTAPMSFGNAIVLDDRASDKKNWQAFGHELCHAMWHAGGQINMPPPLRSYQETKANNFALYACIPSFMLAKVDWPPYKREAVRMIQETFGVEKDFAERRFNQYASNWFAQNE